MRTAGRFLFGAVFVMVVAAQAAAQNLVFVVRHAEKAAAAGAAGMMADDPDLSDEGHARAESLARLLKDAGIKTIVATEFKRTQQTAAPLAKALGIKVVSIGSRDSAKLVETARKATGNVLVVGHSNTVPMLLKELGVRESLTIDDSEYDNLFIVATGSQPRMVRLHFR